LWINQMQQFAAVIWRGETAIDESRSIDAAICCGVDRADDHDEMNRPSLRGRPSIRTASFAATPGSGQIARSRSAGMCGSATVVRSTLARRPPYGAVRRSRRLYCGLPTGGTRHQRSRLDSARAEIGIDFDLTGRAGRAPSPAAGRNAGEPGTRAPSGARAADDLVAQRVNLRSRHVEWPRQIAHSRDTWSIPRSPTGSRR